MSRDRQAMKNMTKRKHTQLILGNTHFLRFLK